MPKPALSDLATHPDTYLTVPAFAEYLNVPDKSVRKWIRAGVLPAYCFHGVWRIAKMDAVLFVEPELLQSLAGGAARAAPSTSVRTHRNAMNGLGHSATIVVGVDGHVRLCV